MLWATFLQRPEASPEVLQLRTSHLANGPRGVAGRNHLYGREMTEYRPFLNTAFG